MSINLLVNTYYDLMVKNFLSPKLKCSSSRYFYRVLWQFLSSGFRFPPSQSFGRAGGIFGQTLARDGSRGEMRPNYFKYRPPNRKLQARGSRLASCLAGRRALGDQIVRNFGRKNQLAILHFGKRKFLIKTV
jgi:hypothetical protein